MNHIHKLVWSSLHGHWMVAPEIAGGAGARTSASPARRVRRTRPAALAAGALATLVALAASPAALAQRVGISNPAAKLLPLVTATPASTSPAALAATTLPQGGQVVQGQGQATLQGAGSANAPVLNIDQSSQRAVIDWKSFDLGSAATVNFNQPNAQSATLNRVQDVNPSQIFGHINAPGQVTLVNPNGVYFSPGAVLDVGALTATTLQQSDADFMAGKANFTRSGATGSVVNAGSLNARDYIALLAPEVRNEGRITVATAGSVVMAAGEVILLNFDAASRLSSIAVTPSQIAAVVENKSAVLAPGGLIILSATALSGLQASVINSGQIDAGSLSTKGGRIVLEGDSIQLGNGSRLNASGATGGGTVLVGGDWQGSGTMAQATTVTMASDASIDASATQSGDGGRVVLWSDVANANSNTTVNGSITARGGALGGNGGQVETSGHQLFTEGTRVDTLAPQGRTGLWLLDPNSYTVAASGGNTTGAVIAGNLNSSNVTIQTSATTPGDEGDIVINDNIAYTGGSARTLTFKAHNDITLNSGKSITSTTAALNTVFRSRFYTAAAPDNGAVTINGNIDTHGGGLWIGGGSGDAFWTPYAGAADITVANGIAATWTAGVGGVSLTGAAITTGAGNVYMAGQEFVSTRSAGVRSDGVRINNSSITTTGGNIRIVGDVTGAFDYGLGVALEANGGNTTLQTDSGSISISGTGSDNNTDGTGYRHGVRLKAATASHSVTLSSDSGAIDVNGAANFTDARTIDTSGLQLQADTTTSRVQVVSHTGAISLKGSNSQEAGVNENAIRFMTQDAADSIRIGYDGSHAYSGNILIEGNSLQQLNQNVVVGSIAVQSTGTLTVQSAGNAFTYLRAGGSGTLTFDDDWNFGTGLSAFTLGKSTNTLDLTLSNALTTAGPISLHGGNIALNANLTTTAAGGAILAKGSGNVTTGNNQVLQTNGGAITLWADSDANGGYILLNESTKLDSRTAAARTTNDEFTNNGTTATGGGDITLGGGNGATAAAGYAWSTGTAERGGVNFGDQTYNSDAHTNLTTIYSGGGNIVVRGKQTLGTMMGINWVNGGTLNAGTGTVTLDGTSAGGQGMEIGSWQRSGSANIYAGGGNAGTPAITVTGANTTAGSKAVQTNVGSFVSNGAGGIGITGTASGSGSGSVVLGSNLTSTLSGAGILAKASGNIVAADGRVLQTNGGAITLWADSDAVGSGYIQLVNNNRLDSRTAAARTANVEASNLTSATGGGAITLGGGNGATAADGYALSAGTTGLGGVNLGDQSNTNNVTTLYAGGGDVVIRGKQSGSSAMGVQWINGGLLNAGQGKVRIEGLNTGGGHGMELGAFRQSGQVLMYAGGGDAGTPALDLRGTGAGAGTGVQVAVAKLYSTGTGGINVVGTAGAGGTWGLLAGDPFDALAASGPIMLDGGTAGIRMAGSIGAVAGSSVPASSSNVTLTGNSVQFSGGAAVRTTGTLTVQPFGTSFSGALSWPLTNFVALAPAVGGLTLGKPGNTADITVTGAQTLNGPIRIHAGNINLNANLTSTLAGAGISALASGSITTNNAITLATNGGALLLAADTDGAGGGIFNAVGDFSASTSGGAITIGGGNMGGTGYATGFGTGTTNATGIRFRANSTLNSGGGNISLKGKSFTSGGDIGAAATGLWFAGSSIDSGTGTVVLEGVGQAASTSDYTMGMMFGWASGSTSISSANTTANAIRLVGNAATAGNASFNSGMRFYNNGTSITATGVGGGITLEGTRNAAGNPNDFSFADSTGTGTTSNILANGGPINLSGKSVGGAAFLGAMTLGSKAATTVTSSSSNVTITADALTINGAVGVDTTGTLAMQPYSASFGSALNWGTGITVAPSISGLRLGKAGNTADITIGIAENIAGPVQVYGGTVTVNQNLASSTSGDITVFADGLAFGASGRLASGGNLNIATTTAGRTIGLGGGTGLLAIAGSAFTTNFVDGFSAINIGDANSGKITSGAVTASDSLLLRNAGAGIDITGAVNVGGNTLTLNSTGAVAEAGSGAITAANLALLGAGGSFALNGAGNNVATLAAGTAGARVGAVSYIDSNALGIGSVGAATGIQSSGSVAVATASGDLTVSQAMDTTNATAAAVVLNAGQSAAAGTATGGNLIISGSPTITTGAGGRATLYTGSLAGSTGVGALVGSGSGHFRYNSDEAASNFSPALSGGGSYAIYREQPTLTLTGSSSTITYGSAAPGSLATLDGGAHNGDSITLGSSIGGTTSSSGKLTAGSHAVTPLDLSGLGYATSATTGTLTVNPKAVTVSGFTATGKVYDGNMVATVNGGGAVVTGLVSGDVVTVSATGAFADKNIGIGKTVTLTSGHGGADAGNYSFTDQASTAADITPKGLTVTGTAAASKVYDRSTAATLSGGSLVGVVGGDVVTLAQAGNFASVNVGTGIVVAASDSIGGAGAGNYTLAQPTGLSADITAKALTVSGTTVADKVYDRTTAAALSGGSLVGVIGGDTVTLTQTGSFAGVNVGNNIAVTASDSLGGAASGNYSLTQPTGLNADITPKTVTVSGTSVADKVYDRTTTAALSGGTLSGVIGGDTVTLTQTGSFAGADVGTNIAVTASDSLGGVSAANYVVTQPSGLSADITAKSLTVSGTTVADKVYDRTTTASLSGGTLSGVIGGDTVTLTQTGSFAGADVGTNIAVTASDSLGGAASGNYTLTQPTGLNADITPKALTVAGTAVADKVYDRTTAATLSGGSLVGVIGGDTVTLTQTGSFASVNVGNNIAVTSTDSLGGAASGNYSLTQPSGLNADITPKTVTVSGTSVADKVYDRTTSASLSGGTLSGVIGGDTVTLTQTGSFAGADVGTNIAVTASDSLGGVSAANYVVTQSSGLSADITPKSLTVSGTSVADKVYDRTTAATVSGGSLVGVVGGDSVTLTQAGAFVSANAGTGVAVIASDSIGGTSSSNYTLAQPATLSADIAPKALTVSGTTVADKVYDRTTTAALSGGTLSGVIGGDTVSLTQTGSFTSANVGNGIAVTASDSLGGVSAANYVVTQSSGLSADITPKSLTVSGTTVADKVYDRTTAAALSGGSLVGVIGGDTVTLTQTGNFAQSNVGNNIAVTASDSLGGAASGNYTLTQPTGLNADITPKALTVAGTAVADKVYDRTTAATLSGGSLVGVIGGDTVTLTQTGSFASVNVGNNIAVTSTDSLGGAASGNYSLTQPSGLNADITPKTVTVNGTSVADKGYDRTTSASLSGGTLSGVIGGDTVTLTQTGSFASVNVGNNIAVTSTDSLGGAASGNYSLTQPSGLNADITPKTVTVSGTSVADKVYDRTTAAALSGGTLVGVIGGDTVTLTQTGNFAQSNVGNNIAVTASDSLGGAASGNYSLTQPTGLNADITPKALTVAGTAVADKVYDRTTAATVSGGSLVGVVGGDSVTLTQTGSFASVNVGNNIAVTSTDSLGGAASGNYSLTQPSGLNADITPKTVTVSGTSVADKGYDRTTTAALSGGTLSGVIGGDTVTLTQTGSFAGADVGTNIAVTASDSLGGAASGNYTLTQPTGLNADITPKTLTVAGTAVADKVYDRTTAATLSGGSLVGVIGGDTVTLTQTGSFASVNVGNNIAVTSTDSLGGAASGNYSLTQPSGLNADITPKTVTVSGTSVADKVYDRTTTAALSGGTLSGVIGGDTVTLTQTGNFAQSNVGNNIAVTSTDSLGGAASGNYSLTQPSGLNADITPKTVTVSGTSVADKVYDRTTTAALSGGTLSGVIGGDTVTLTQTGAFVSANAGTGVAVIASDSIGGTSSSNYTLAQPAALSADIAPKALTVSRTTVADKVYDRTTTASLSGGTLSGVIGGDTVSLTQTGSFASANVGNGIAVTASDSVGGASAANYVVTQPTALSADITPKALTVSGTTVVDKVYDKATMATLSGGTLVGVVSGDSLTLTQAGAFATANAGTSIAVTASDSIGGAASGNYTLVQPAGLAGEITPKTLAVSGTTVANKVYDGSAAATLSGGTLSGVLSGDNVSLAQAGSFTSIHAGTAVAVTAGDTLLGAASGNYRLAQPGGLSADIAPKALTVSGSVAADKVYDRSTAAVVSGGVLAGVVVGDTVTLAESGQFASRDVGSAIAVTATSSLGGTSAGDYLLTQPTGLTADITPKALTVSGTTVADKVYDRSTTASLSGGVLSGVIAGDSVGLAQSGNFASPNAGSAIAVLASTSLTGPSAGNYAVTQPTGLAGDIAPKSVSVSGTTVAEKVYDKTTAAVLGGGTLTGVVGGDSVTVTQIGNFATVNVGTHIAVTASDSLAGAAAGNYVLTQPTGLAADITPKPLVLNGDIGLDKTYDGRSDLAATGHDALAGVLPGDALLLQGAARYANANAGAQAIVQGSLALSGASAGNYSLAWTNGSGSIAPAALTVVANNDARFVVQPDAAGYSGVSYSGFVNGETSAVLSSTAVITRSNLTTNAAGEYAGALVPSGASAANYAVTFVPGSYTIVPANQLLVRVPNVQSTYGSTVTYGPVQASYLASDNTTIVDLSSAVTAAGNALTVTDGASGTASFTVAPMSARLSSSGALAVGAYQLGADQVTATSANFSDKLVVVGAQQVDPKGVSLAVGGVSKVYDGTAGMGSLQLAASGLGAGDSATPTGTGQFETRNAGTSLVYSVTGLHFAGADAGNYYVIGGSSISGTDGVITPKPVTLAAPVVSKVYDGSSTYMPDAATLAALSQQLGVPGDSLTGISLVFPDKNVAAGAALTPSAAAIADGNGGGNYAVSYAGSQGNTISRLPSVAWVGGATGNWFDPANWAGGAVPDLANVANVVIPQNVTVSFGNEGVALGQTGPVQIDRLGNAGTLAMQAGTLQVGTGGVQLAGLVQTGGSLSSQGAIDVGSFEQAGGSTATDGNFGSSEHFAQTGAGTLTVVGGTHIVDRQGGVILGNLSSGGPLVVQSQGGGIVQQAGSALATQAGSTLTARTADGAPADIRLDAAGNRWGGSVNANGADVTLVSGGPAPAALSGLLTARAETALRAPTLANDSDLTRAQQLQPVSEQSKGWVHVQLAENELRLGSFAIELAEQAARTLRDAPETPTARLPDGEPLPGWLHFDAERLSFSAVAMPAGALPLVVLIRAGVYSLQLEIAR